MTWKMYPEDESDLYGPPPHSDDPSRSSSNCRHTPHDCWEELDALREQHGGGVFGSGLRTTHALLPHQVLASVNAELRKHRP